GADQFAQRDVRRLALGPDAVGAPRTGRRGEDDAAGRPEPVGLPAPGEERATEGALVSRAPVEGDDPRPVTLDLGDQRGAARLGNGAWQVGDAGRGDRAEVGDPD